MMYFHFKPVIRKVPSEEVEALFESEEAIVQTICSKLHDDSDWNFNIRQHADPTFRPVKELNPESDRSIYYDAKDQKWWGRDIKGPRGREKEDGFLKKKAGTLSPKDGQINLYSANFRNTGLIYDCKYCDLKDERYVFLEDANTNLRAWIYKNQVGENAQVYKAVTLNQVRLHNRKARAADIVLNVWNEILFAPSNQALVGIFARVNNLATRLNALHKKMLVLKELGYDLPIFIVTSTAPKRLYTIKNQIDDIHQAINQPKTIAHGFTRLLFNNDFAQVSRYISRNCDIETASEIFLDLVGSKQNWRLADLLFDHYKTMWDAHFASSGYNVLHFAVIYNQPDLVRKLCRDNFDICKPAAYSRQFRTPLSIAVYNRNYRIIRILLTEGQSIPPAQILGEIIYHIVKANLVEHFSLVSIILEKFHEIDFSLCDPITGYSSLHFAVMHKQHNLVAELTSSGANVVDEAFLCRQNRTPLSIAMHNKDFVSFNKLVTHSFYLSQAVKDKTLVYALRYEQWDSVSHLVAQGAQVQKNAEVRTQHLKKGLNLALKCSNSDAVSSFVFHTKTKYLPQADKDEALLYAITELQQLVIPLIKIGAKPNAYCKKNKLYALTMALQNLSELIVEQMIDANLSLAVANEALLKSALMERFNATQKLLELPVDVNCEHHGNSALHYSVKGKHIELTKNLCRQKANVSKVNQEGDTPLDIAIKAKNYNLVAVLVLNDTDTLDSKSLDKALIFLCEDPNWDANKFFIRALKHFQNQLALKIIPLGVNISNPIAIDLAIKAHAHGVVCLMLDEAELKRPQIEEAINLLNGYLLWSKHVALLTALVRQNYIVATCLVKVGAAGNAYCDDHECFALWLGLQSNEPDLIRGLLANQHQKEALSHSTLYAAINKKWALVGELLKHPFDLNLNAFPRTGNFVLHEAIIENQADLIVSLCERGADATIKNNEANTALDLACAARKFLMIKTLLLKHKKELPPEEIRKALLILNDDPTLNKNGMLLSALRHKKFVLAVILLQQGASPNLYCEQSHCFALWLGIESLRNDLINEFITANPDINVIEHTIARCVNRTAYQAIAIRLLNFDISADNFRYPNGTSFLYAAVLHLNPALIEALCAKGASASVRGFGEKSPVELAIDEKKYVALQTIFLKDKKTLTQAHMDQALGVLCLDPGFDRKEFLSKAITEKQDDLILKLLYMQIYPADFSNAEGFYVLDLILRRSHLGLLDKLPSAANVKVIGNIILLAARYNLIELVKKFIKPKMDLNVLVHPESGNSVLHYAVLNKNEELVKFFHAHKADLNLANDQKNSPFDLAIQERAYPIIKTILLNASNALIPRDLEKALSVLTEESTWDKEKFLAEANKHHQTFLAQLIVRFNDRKQVEGLEEKQVSEEKGSAMHLQQHGFLKQKVVPTLSLVNKLEGLFKTINKTLQTQPGFEIASAGIYTALVIHLILTKKLNSVLENPQKESLPQFLVPVIREYLSFRHGLYVAIHQQQEVAQMFKEALEENRVEIFKEQALIAKTAEEKVIVQPGCTIC